MKRKTLTYIVILATITIAGAILLQFFFLRHSYNNTEKQFRESVTIALREVSWQLLSASGQAMKFDSIAPVEIVSKSYFRVIMDAPVDYDLLKSHLKEELKKHQIYTDFEFAIYNPDAEQLEQQTYITTMGEESASTFSFPVDTLEDSYYFAVHFPDRSSYFKSSLTLWYLFTGLLLVIILFFGYTLSVIIRQRQLSQIQKDFINNLTHELKTPISSIALSAKVIHDKKILDNPDRLIKYTDIILEQNERLAKNVEKVLNLAALEKTKLHLKKESINLEDFLTTVVEHFKQTDFGRKANIMLVFSKKPIYIMADNFHFTNLVLNILENGVKYNEQSPELKIKISKKKSKAYIRFTDNGIGIPKQYRKKIFQRFYRIPTGNVHNVKGFGLGLNYVRKILKAHRWGINVEENPGGGSIFTLIIPLNK